MLFDLAAVDDELILFADLVGVDARHGAAAHDQLGDAFIVEDQRAFFAVWDQVCASAVWFDAERTEVEQATHEAFRCAVLQLRRACQRGDSDPCEAVNAQVLW